MNKNYSNSEFSSIKGAISGSELIKKLSLETRKALEEMSKLSENDWKKYYKKLKASERRRLKLLKKALNQ